MATYYQTILKNKLEEKLNEISSFQQAVPDYERRIINPSYLLLVDNADALAFELIHLSQ